MDQVSDMIDMNAASRQRRGAGEEFLCALRKLGLNPDALLWAFETNANNRMVLILMTSFFDYAGPLEVSRLLFKAYNASAIPSEINPFIVRLHSPRQAFGRELMRLKPSITDSATGRSVPAGSGTLWAWEEGLSFAFDGVLKFPSRASTTVEQSRRWHRFSQNVDRLAA